MKGANVRPLHLRLRLLVTNFHAHAHCVESLYVRLCLLTCENRIYNLNGLSIIKV